MLIIIPTRNRIKELTNTLNFLNNNNFFFKKVVIVDSSNFNIKKKIKKKINSYDLNIKLVDSQPSTCLQRNIGFNFIKHINIYLLFVLTKNNV